MKCRSRRSISISCILLLLIAVLSLSACGQDTAPAVPNTSVDNNPQYTPNADPAPSIDIVGEWRTQAENVYISLLFHSDMSFEIIGTTIEDSSLDYYASGVYSVSDNLVTATYDSTSDEMTYDPQSRTLSSYGLVYTYITAQIDTPTSLAGTWQTLSEKCSFPLAFGDILYDRTYSITFYHDGSYELNHYGDYGIYYSHDTGTYQIIQDGSAIKIDDTDYRDPGIMKYELISDNILLIESRPDNYPGRYYVLVQTN